MEQKNQSAGQESGTRTRGEYIFDTVSYIGIGGVVNAAISIAFSDWVHNAWTKLPPEQQASHASKKVFDFIYGTNAETLAKPLQGWLGEAKKITNAAGQVEYLGALKHTQRFMQGAVLGSGGWIVLPVIKYLEDHKQSFVNYFNGGSNNAKDDVEMGDKVKQTWTGLLGGRTVSFLTPLFVAAPILDVYQKKTGTDIFQAMGEFSRDYLHIKPEKFVKGMTEARGKELSYQLAGETFYTAIGITVLYTLSKMISSRIQAKEENTSKSKAKEDEFIDAPPDLTPAEIVKSDIPPEDKLPPKTKSPEVVAAASPDLKHAEHALLRAESTAQTSREIAKAEPALNEAAPDNQVTNAQHLHAIAPANQTQAHISS